MNRVPRADLDSDRADGRLSVAIRRNVRITNLILYKDHSHNPKKEKYDG